MAKTHEEWLKEARAEAARGEGPWTTHDLRSRQDELNAKARREEFAAEAKRWSSRKKK